MTSRGRVLALVIPPQIIASAFIGGYLGEAMSKNDTYHHLRMFEVDTASCTDSKHFWPVYA